MNKLKNNHIGSKDKYAKDILKHLANYNINENSETKAKEKIEEMCKNLLVNLIIEDFKIFKI